MGERDHDRDQHGQPTGQPETGRRVTVREAAVELGISVEAVRNRIKRGTLRSVKEPGKKESASVYVILDGDHARTDQPTAGRDQPTDQPGAGRDQPRPDDQPAALVEELRDRIAYLERQVVEEREARRRADTLMARLMDRVPELPAASHEEPRESPESVREAATGTNTTPTSASPQTRIHRPWWRRILGG